MYVPNITQMNLSLTTPQSKLDPMTHTGLVDSRLNMDKNVLITQILVFPSVWNPGWINSSLLSKMCGIQNVAPILVFPDN